MQDDNKRWTFVTFLLIVILGNLIIIDAAIFWGGKTPKTTKLSTAVKTSTSPTQAPKDQCGDACKLEIQKAIEEASIQPSVKQSSSSVKEYFVTLGSGSSTSEGWTDVPGAQSYIDSTSYGKIRTVTFEASLYTPTGNQTAYARLFNVTDSHTVWNSEVSIEGGTPQLKISNPIILDPGSKLYQVQMKTQLQSRTNLENARIHIATY